MGEVGGRGDEAPQGGAFLPRRRRRAQPRTRGQRPVRVLVVRRAETDAHAPRQQRVRPGRRGPRAA
eukprot:3544267-Rhodomonas_salina.1